MEFLREIGDLVTTGWGDRLGILFPLLATGLVGLYVLWLVLGYLRVSQVGIAERRSGGEAVPLLRSSEGAPTARGVPYCAFDGLQYPAGARFCTSCERDLTLNCVNCDATLTAGESTCYRCGTPTGA
jgi:hypothetical protein